MRIFEYNLKTLIMNTLEKILKQDAFIAEQEIVLDDLKKQYVKENAKYSKGDIVFAKEYDSDIMFEKYSILSAKYDGDGEITYNANKFNKNGTFKKSSRSYFGNMVYKLKSKNIKK
jgi:hypothetical protein